MKSVKYKVQIVKLKSPDKENRDFAKNAQLFTTECTEDTEQELLSDLEQELRPRITRISRNDLEPVHKGHKEYHKGHKEYSIEHKEGKQI
jgi:hypothetical protein